jgi:hypothetical protein
LYKLLYKYKVGVAEKKCQPVLVRLSEISSPLSAPILHRDKEQGKRFTLSPVEGDKVSPLPFNLSPFPNFTSQGVTFSAAAPKVTM